MLKETKALTMEAKSPHQHSKTTESQPHYPELNEDAASELTPVNPDAFNAYDDAVSACKEMEEKKNDDHKEEGAGVQS